MMHRLSPALLALCLVACGGTDDGVAVEEQADAPEVVAIEGRDITAIDAATDNDAGLVDDEVPGRRAAADEADED